MVLWMLVRTHHGKCSMLLLFDVSFVNSAMLVLLLLLVVLMVVLI